jgi:hypothetical protein
LTVEFEDVLPWEAKPWLRGDMMMFMEELAPNFAAKLHRIGVGPRRAFKGNRKAAQVREGNTFLLKSSYFLL